MTQEANYEDMPPMEEPQPSNGNGHSNNRAGTDKMFVGSEDSGFFELPKVLLETAIDLQTAMIRGRLNSKQGAAAMDVMAEIDQYSIHGYIDTARVLQNKIALSTGEDGEARKEAIHASTGGRQFNASLRSLGDNIFGRGPQTNGTGQREGPQ